MIFSIFVVILGLSADIAAILNSVRSGEKTKYKTLKKDLPAAKSFVENFENKISAIEKSRHARTKKYNTNIVLGDFKKNRQIQTKKALEKSIVMQPEFDALKKVPVHNISDKKLKRVNRVNIQKFLPAYFYILFCFVA